MRGKLNNMGPQIKKWSDEISTVLLRAKTVNDALYRKAQSEGDIAWYLSGDGLRLHDAIEKAFTTTVAIWNDPLVCAWNDDDVVSNSLLTQSLLEVLTMDYVYRTNNAPPSDPLWRNLEAKLDMPAELSKLEAGWTARSASTPDRLNNLRRVLALTALCRTEVAYALTDTVQNQTIWRDMKELKMFWGLQDDSAAAKHRTLVRGMDAFPSSIGEFYAYAASAAIPDTTVQYAFEHFTPTPTNGEDAMVHWCSWLATLQGHPQHWASAQARWPELTSLLTMVGALEEPVRVGPVAWGLHSQRNTVSLTVDSADAAALSSMQGEFV